MYYIHGFSYFDRVNIANPFLVICCVNSGSYCYCFPLYNSNFLNDFYSYFGSGYLKCLGFSVAVVVV